MITHSTPLCALLLVAVAFRTVIPLYSIPSCSSTPPSQPRRQSYQTIKRSFGLSFPEFPIHSRRYNTTVSIVLPLPTLHIQIKNIPLTCLPLRLHDRPHHLLHPLPHQQPPPNQSPRPARPPSQHLPLPPLLPALQ